MKKTVWICSFGVVVLLWGAYNVFKGMAASFVINGPNQTAQAWFVSLTFLSILPASLIWFFYPRISAILLLLAGLVAIIIEINIGAPSGFVRQRTPLLMEVFTRPVATAIALGIFAYIVQPDIEKS